MTLTETDRLIRRMREFLNDSVSGATTAGTLAAPAQAYADACSGAERRLEQCAAMLDAGDEQQALQLAETNPPLLDLLTRLSFAESHAWRTYCQSLGLPVPENIDTRLVARLNALYATGITVQHPLYRDYRAQVMRNRPEEAAATLRSIVRLNPGDANAREELVRVENKRLDTRLQDLAKALSAGDKRAAATLVDAIEDQAAMAGLNPSGPVWESGLNARRKQFQQEALAECRALLPPLDALRAAGKWQAAIPMLAHAKALQAEHGFGLEPETQRRFDDLRAWTARSQADHERCQAFDRAVAELELAIEQSEGRQSVVRTGTPPILQAELSNLQARWRSVEESGQPLPDGLELRYRKQARLVRLEIERGQRQRTTRLVALCAAAVLCCAAGIYFFVQQQRSSELAGQIDHLVSTRQAGALETLLADTRSRDPRRYDSATVQTAAARARVYLTAEHDHQQSLAARLTQLEGLAGETPQPFASQPPAKVGALLVETQNLTKDIAPEHVPATNARLATVRNRWEAFLASAKTKQEEKFAGMLDTIEKRTADELNYHRPTDDLRRSLTELAEAVTPLDGMVKNPPVPEWKVRADLTTRSDAVQSQLNSFRQELSKYDASTAAIGRSANIDDYLNALRAAAETEPGRLARELAPAKRLLGLSISTDALMAGALMPDDPEGWAFFKANPNAGFVPTSAVLDPERRIYDQLLVDSNIRNVYAYNASAGRGGKAGRVYSRGRLEQSPNYSTVNGWSVGLQGNVYDTLDTENFLNFKDGEIVKFLSSEALAPDTEAFLELRFRDLINQDTNEFTAGATGAPLHDLLDRLTRHPKASSLFKAYVFSRVGQMAQVGRRAGFFGWQFSPAVRANLKRIEQIGTPQSGAWMVPEEIKRHGPAFDSLFAAAAKVSFVQQAKLLQAATHDVFAAGTEFKGHVNAAGEPQLLDTPALSKTPANEPPPADLWGLETREGQLSRLFAWSAKDGGFRPVSGVTALPLTPLVSFAANSADVLSTNAHRLGIKEQDIKGLLAYAPPFFQN